MKYDAKEVLFEAMITGDIGSAIMNQETRGQRQFNASDVLPKKCPREQLETLGFVFGKDVDDLFVEAKLPTGWRKVATSHSMWTSIEDDKGRERASVFYKAAFYDRAAHMNLSRRYSIDIIPVNGYGENYKSEDDRQGQVLDCGIVIWRTSEVARYDDYRKQDELEVQTKLYIEEHYPDYRNPLAYWD